MGLDVTKYVSAILVLAAALTGIIGDTHNDALGITPLGWGAIVVVTLSFVVIVVETYRDQRALSWQERQRREVQRVAHRQIFQAVRVLLGPFSMILHEIWKKNPRGDLVDLGRTNDARYLLRMLGLSEIRAQFHTINLRVSPDVYPPKIWWEFFAEHARSASEKLNSVAAKYSAYLRAETLTALEDLRADEMVGLRLPHFADIVMANERLPNLTLEHAFSGPSGYAALDEMVNRINKLIDLTESKSVSAE